MLIISSTPDPASLENIAERVLKDPQATNGTCADMVRLAFSENDRSLLTAEAVPDEETTFRLRIAKLMSDRNLVDQARHLLTDVNEAAYIHSARFSWQIVLCLKVMIGMGNMDRVLNMICSGRLHRRMTPKEQSDTGLKIAEELLNRNHPAQANAVVKTLDPAHIQNKIHLAEMYGKLGRFDRAEAFIKSAYAADGALKDGFSRLAWVRIVSQYRDLKEAFRLTEKDSVLGRMSSQWKQRFALLMGLLGSVDHAYTFVKHAYEEDSSLYDTYGFVGWGLFLREADRKSLIRCVNRDLRLGRFSMQGRVFKANYLAASAMTPAAVSEVETVYQEDDSLHDLFSGIGWHYFRSGDVTTCCELMGRDWENGKMTPHWRMSYLWALSAAGKCDEVERLLENRYWPNPAENRVVLGFPAMPDRVMSWSGFKTLVCKKIDYQTYLSCQTQKMTDES